MFTGGIIGCGILLVPGLTLAGAIASLLATTMVCVMNLTYDVPVKLFSFHLVVMSLVLLAPDRKRLLAVFVLNRATSPRAEPRLLSGRMARMIAVCVQIAIGVAILGASFPGSFGRV